MSEHWRKYSYSVNAEADTTANRILRLIGENKRVLELGTAVGSMSQLIRERSGCTIVGMEIDPEMAAMAAPWCERMIVGNIESMDLAETLGEDRFDVVVAADVLEHLVDPWGCLSKIRPYLKPHGCLVISVPNVAHNALLAELLGGRFPYQEKGLLDRTHLRFFTRSNLEDMLLATGYLPSVWERNRVLEAETEFATGWCDSDEILKKTLAANPEGQTYQFIVKAFPSTETGWVLKTGEALQAAEASRSDLEKTLSNTLAELTALREEFQAFRTHAESQIQSLTSEALDVSRQLHAAMGTLNETQTALCHIQNRPYVYALRRVIQKARRMVGLDWPK